MRRGGLQKQKSAEKKPEEFQFNPISGSNTVYTVLQDCSRSKLHGLEYIFWPSRVGNMPDKSQAQIHLQVTVREEGTEASWANLHEWW